MLRFGDLVWNGGMEKQMETTLFTGKIGRWAGLGFRT